eukprot:1752013-Amphidinium_carterae.1
MAWLVKKTYQHTAIIKGSVSDRSTNGVRVVTNPFVGASRGTKVQPSLSLPQTIAQATIPPDSGVILAPGAFGLECMT